MSYVRSLIFNRQGRGPTEVDIQWEYVAWRLNQVGRARGLLPFADPNCTQDVLQLGNLILVQFENGLPDFGGVIDVPRGRRWGAGITINAYSAEQLLTWRRTAKIRTFSATAPGTIFQTLLTEEATDWPMGIEIGNIYTGGSARDETYHYHGLFDVVSNLQRLSGEDWEIIPLYQNGVLTFIAHWYQAKGQDRSGQVVLSEGDNLIDLTIDEQGPIANQIFCPGGGAGGTTWSDRNVGEASDEDSRDRYGYREYSEVLTGIFDQPTLDASASALLATYKDPRVRPSMRVANCDPAGFSDYDVADRVTVQALLDWPQWSIDQSVRIVAREWSPDDTCRLEAE